MQKIVRSIEGGKSAISFNPLHLGVVNLSSGRFGGFGLIFACRIDRSQHIAQRVNFVVNVDFSSDVDVLVAEQFLNSIYICAVPTKVCAIGVPQLVCGHDRHFIMLAVQLAHKAFELLRPCVRAIGLAVLIREQIQGFFR